MEFDNRCILIVDDDYSVRKKLEIILSKNNLKSKSFDSGLSAIEELRSNHKHYSLILLDVTMEGLSGFDTAKKIKENPQFIDIPIIFITGNSDTEDKRIGFQVGCVDYITKPFDNNEVLMRVKLHLELSYRRELALNYARDLERKVVERTYEIQQVRKALIVSLSTLAESRDPETGAHILRTQEYSKALATELKNLPKYKDMINDHFIDRVYDCSPLHDIGKVGIPDNVLLKPDKLTDDEFNIMKSHSFIGYKTLISASDIPVDNSFLRFAADIAYSHHEKYDGTGYPRRLKGDDIPLQGRIMAIADVYDALISKRVYKDAWEHNRARDFIANGKGAHFDPDIVDVFLKIEKQFLEIKEKYKDEEENL
ncbi:MAG TPA: response regulator [Spirochaetota bacterium]|nr:response regulator [Spirochaetota bacterium]